MADSANRRIRTVKVRVSDSELAQLRARAGEGDLAGWLRSVGLGARPTRRAAADPALLAGLARIGNNLNQLARASNAAGKLPTIVALTAIERELAALRCTSAG